MRVIDTVKPPAKTKLEDFERWQNHLYAQLLTRPYHRRLKITVKTEGDS